MERLCFHRQTVPRWMHRAYLSHVLERFAVEVDGARYLNLERGSLCPLFYISHQCVEEARVCMPVVACLSWDGARLPL